MQNKKGNVTVIAVIIVIVAIIAGIIGWLFAKKTQTLAPQAVVTQTTTPVAQTQPGAQSAPQQVAQPIPVDETINWKVFHSKQEGFTLKYPNDWKLQDGDNIDCGVTGAGCPQRVTFTSPDGIMVRYVQYDDVTTDKLTCTQAPCTGNKVTEIEKLDIPNFGQALLVKGDKSMWLDQPLSAETIPTIGENLHKGFDISFNMPSKNGKRYSMFLYMNYANDGTTKFDKLTNDEFFNLDSVKKATLIFESIAY